MTELLTFICARLDESEAQRRMLLTVAQRNDLAVKEPRLLGREIPGWFDWPAVEMSAEQALREIAATRRIVAECESALGTDDGLAEFVLRNFGTTWEGHPDYRPEWSPPSTSSGSSS